jgi:hypothetical protein
MCAWNLFLCCTGTVVAHGITPRSYEERDVSVQGQGKLLNVSSLKTHIIPFFLNQKSQM